MISCGKDNIYGHPKTETLETLTQEGAEICRTDEIGSFDIFSDGTNVGIG